MKKVVINGGGCYGGLLTPKLVIEYLKRKNIIAYVYVSKPGSLTDFYFEKQDPNEMDSNDEIYCEMYLTIDKDRLTMEEHNNLPDECFINKDDIFKNREDQTLIDIANEINNEDLLKIVEIPNDVSYYIKESECGFGECIVECHRVWY